MAASKKIFLMIAVLFVSFLGVKLCVAQGLQKYQPATPTVSPYLSLDRFNTGGLPNYYTLVRPVTRQRQVNQLNQRQQLQQQAAIQNLERTIVQPIVPQASTGVSSRYLTSGARAVYRDTRQFYPPINLRR